MKRWTGGRVKLAHDSLREAIRGKRIAMMINSSAIHNDGRFLMDVIVEGRAQNPEELIIDRENLVSLRDQVDQVLSSLEQEVLNAYLDGKSYQEIADKLGRHVKSIDNALQRVKRKLEKFLEESRAKEEE